MPDSPHDETVADEEAISSIRQVIDEVSAELALIRQLTADCDDPALSGGYAHIAAHCELLITGYLNSLIAPAQDESISTLEIKPPNAD
ncbi:hypothetical protein FHS96_003105 [Sphingomonas zeicaulis]|uniref:hypothetical protein n=1 Tax=Sphingomonas zeicaulis TaxID=1632740 RepID=UPI003D1E726A